MIGNRISLCSLITCSRLSTSTASYCSSGFNCAKSLLNIVDSGSQTDKLIIDSVSKQNRVAVSLLDIHANQITNRIVVFICKVVYVL